MRGECCDSAGEGSGDRRCGRRGSRFGLGDRTRGHEPPARARRRRRRDGKSRDTGDDEVVLRPITLPNATIPTGDGGTINYIDSGIGRMLAR